LFDVLAHKMYENLESNSFNAASVDPV